MTFQQLWWTMKKFLTQSFHQLLVVGTFIQKHFASSDFFIGDEAIPKAEFSVSDVFHCSWHSLPILYDNSVLLTDVILNPKSKSNREKML
jgi:hypothetical protein